MNFLKGSFVMSNFDFLKEKPFYLDDARLDWVKGTLGGLSQADKIGQLFCLCAVRGTEDEVQEMMKIKPGGIMYRPFTAEQAVNLTNLWAKHAEIPMLIAANLEKGGNGIVAEGTSLGSPTQVAATDDAAFAAHLGEVCGSEGKAVGANWAFAPIIDIDYNFRNPITNTRTFGSDPDRVREFGKVYVENVQKYGVAASIKHFPGDGRDERDQHLVTSINDFSAEEWDETYGKIYKASIDAGALTVMIGHIMQPAWSKKLNPALTDEEIMPATLAPELMQGLLREKLGFNGLICTDATSMAGYTIPMPREKAVPYSIAAGADVFLFTKNTDEDYAFMTKGVEDGIITAERLDDAVARILGLKAALKLHEPQEPLTLEGAMKVLSDLTHKAWAKECADKAVTLVKEEKGVLPISPDKYKRVLFFPVESDEASFFGPTTSIKETFKPLLEKEGFTVDVFTPPQGMEGRTSKASDIVENYDLLIYAANMSTKSNQTTVRITWQQPMGCNTPQYIQQVPTIFISVENPYHLLDVPRVKTFINAYSSSDATLEAIIDKLMGRSEFRGVNPVDPFCGRWDTKL